MIDPNKKEREPLSPQDVCYRAFELIATKQYADAEKLLANNLARTDDDAAIALFHSVMGVLFKVQGEYKVAWKHYERAEKLLPKDAALKIISARLLIEQFAEYGLAIKKAKKVLELLPGNHVFAHQAHTTMGLAFLKKGDKKKAVEELVASLVNDFEGFVTAKNIDFSLVELLLKKGTGIDECRLFLNKAYAFAEKTNDDFYLKLIGDMKNAFERDFPKTVDMDVSSNRNEIKNVC